MEEPKSPPQPFEIVVRYGDKTLSPEDENESECGEFHPAVEEPTLSSNEEDDIGDDLIVKRRRRMVERQLTSLSDGSIDEFEASEADEDLKFCFPALDSAKETAEHFVKKVRSAWRMVGESALGGMIVICIIGLGSFVESDSFLLAARMAPRQ